MNQGKNIPTTSWEGVYIRTENVITKMSRLLQRHSERIPGRFESDVGRGR